MGDSPPPQCRAIRLRLSSKNDCRIHNGFLGDSIDVLDAFVQGSFVVVHIDAAPAWPDTRQVRCHARGTTYTSPSESCAHAGVVVICSITRSPCPTKSSTNQSVTPNSGCSCRASMADDSPGDSRSRSTTNTRSPLRTKCHARTAAVVLRPTPTLNREQRVAHRRPSAGLNRRTCPPIAAGY